jgi:type I restriction enzyme S subunit
VLKRLVRRKITDGPHVTPEFVDGGVPFLSVDSIQNSRLVFDNCRTISIDAHREYSRKCRPRRGDLLIAKAASTGKVALVDVDDEFSVWSPLALVSPEQRRIQSRFLFYALISHEVQARIDLLSTFNTQKNVSMGDLENLQVPVPPLREQRAIADLLDREVARIDELIGLKHRLSTALEEQWRATRALATTPPGRMAHTWQRAKVGRFIRLQRGFDISGAANACGAVPVISSGGYSGVCENPICKGPGVVVGRKGTLGTVFYENGNYWPHSTSLFVVDFKGSLPRFVYYFLQYLELEHLDVGAANPTLNRNHVHPLEVDWPDIEGQKRIAAFLDAESARISELRFTLAKARDILHEWRASLISAAVTGQIDLRRDRPQEAATACL